MKKRVLVCAGVAVAVGAVALVGIGNAISPQRGPRHWLAHAINTIVRPVFDSCDGCMPQSGVSAHLPSSFRPDPDFPLQAELEQLRAAAEHLPMPRLVEEEDVEAVEVIDLTELQKTSSPAADEGEEPPADLPRAFDVPVLVKKGLQPPAPVVPEFLPHSADGQMPEPELAEPTFWQRLGSLIMGNQMAPGPDGRFIPLPSPHRLPAGLPQHPSCPYTGGCPYDGGQYRQSAKTPPAINSGGNVLDGLKPEREQISWRWIALPF
jgi:hypothetical protein